jgi:hypothetical protein
MFSVIEYWPINLMSKVDWLSSPLCWWKGSLLVTETHPFVLAVRLSAERFSDTLIAVFRDFPQL